MPKVQILFQLPEAIKVKSSLNPFLWAGAPNVPRDGSSGCTLLGCTVRDHTVKLFYALHPLVLVRNAFKVVDDALQRPLLPPLSRASEALSRIASTSVVLQLPEATFLDRIVTQS